MNIEEIDIDEIGRLVGRDLKKIAKPTQEETPLTKANGEPVGANGHALEAESAFEPDVPLPDSIPEEALAAEQDAPSSLASDERRRDKNKHESDSGELQSARASTYAMTAIEWLWPNRFALGKVGIIAGLPDEGKGQVIADMAGRITRGMEWPCGEGKAPQGNVILLTAEDDISDTVVPRLLAAGADLNCVEIVRMVRSNNKDRMFSLVTDLGLLRQKIVDVGNVRLIQIDPISAYLGVGKVDSFRTTDVRAVLGPVVDLASELMVAVIGIMHFNKKTDVTNALLRISDSLAFGATARHVYAVVDDAENNRKLFVKGKNNLAAGNGKALAFGFNVRDVGHDQKSGKSIVAPHIVWHPKHVDVTASEAMQAATEGKRPAAREDAKKFLADMLAAGPVAKKEIEDAAEANCISERTLARAKDELHVIARKDRKRFDGPWYWQLPDQPAVDDSDR